MDDGRSKGRSWRLARAALYTAALVACRPGLAAPDRPGAVRLDAAQATIHGKTTRFMVLEGIGNICCWTDQADWVSWRAVIPKPGCYVAELRYSCQAGSQGSRFELTVGSARVSGLISDDTGTWYDHRTVRLGEVNLTRPGAYDVAVKPQSKPGQAVMNLAWLRFIPEADYPAYAAEEEQQRARERGQAKLPVYLVSNFHPASCGWLTDFSTERNYCAYSYLEHLNRVRDDPTYAFALSEVNNQMAIRAFEPARFEELKRRVHEGRVELCNAFFLEPTINLSGGEALVKMGVEGLRWQQQVMGVRPRLAWCIDVTGVHEQMGQVVSGLELDGMVYTRDNATGRSLHWLESPDGSRTLAISPGHYSEWSDVFNSRAPLTDAAVRGLVADAASKARRTPLGAPTLVLGGGGDYSLPPAYPGYPRELQSQWKASIPGRDLLFATPSRYLDAILPGIRSGAIALPTTRSGARLSWTSFWVQNPTVKQAYREAEHALQASEAAATIASLTAQSPYPVQPLYDAWLLMLLNMDRNTLWGAAGGMVFEHPTSWDVKDRFSTVRATARQTGSAALHSLMGSGTSLGLFSPLSWRRTDVFAVTLPAGMRPVGAPCQAEPDGTTLMMAPVPAMGTRAVRLAQGPVPLPTAVPVPSAIETDCYVARVDPSTGSLVSLRVKPSGREVLAGPVATVAETAGDYHNTPPRPQRRRLADSAHAAAQVTVRYGPAATTVEAVSTFLGGGSLRRTVRFYRHSPRIDFTTETNDIPDRTVVVVEFPLARDIAETRRGIPYGFSHGAWSRPNPNLAGYADGIQAAIRWSHYAFTGGGGVALLDKGLPGRELNGRTPVLFLMNTQPDYMGYPCAWLSGRGAHMFSYALVAHDGAWKDAGIVQHAWELNDAPSAQLAGVGAERSYVQASGNLVVEALRREGSEIELRMAECLGLAGKGVVTVNLPHSQAWLTDLVGGRRKALPGGPTYRFAVRPQQIITMRLRTPKAVPAVRPLLAWDQLVPAAKLEALRRRLPDRKGLPPSGPGSG